MLAVNNLTKKYKNSDVYSLQDVSFNLKSGEIVGLIGKNGAGKTTLMKMLIKTLKPTSGTVILNSEDIFKKDNQLDEVGILIEPVYYNQLTVLENLNFYLEVNQKNTYTKNIESVLKLVDLWNKKDKKPTSFSFGMKQRLSLAMCLVTEPKIAIMDEPFVGLDPLGVNDLIKALKEWVKKKNMTVLISSHQLSELEELCDRFLYIDKGKLVQSFKKEEELQSTLIINVKDEVVQEITKMNNVSIINNKSIEIPMNASNINKILNILTSSNHIEDVEINKNDQLKNYFKGE